MGKLSATAQATQDLVVDGVNLFPQPAKFFTHG
jgi:hypothetical protein